MSISQNEMRKLLSLILFLALSMQLLSAQESLLVSGKVIGEDDGLPLTGATVLVKGSTQGTIADVEGAFSINVPPGATLVISMIGYRSVDSTGNTAA